MAQGFSLSKIKSTMLSCLIAGTAIFVVGGCQNSTQPGTTQTSDQKKEVRSLEVRLQKLENLIQEISINTSNQNNNSSPAGPIKSLTIRTGTQDDRLRIYWDNGSQSDLPCSKEHPSKFIWACG